MEKHADAQNVAQVPVSAHTFTSCDNKNYYQFGGWDGSRDIAAMFKYDAEARTWSSVHVNGDIPSARHFHSCIGLGNRIILFGGYDGSRWTNDLYSFEPGTLCIVLDARCLLVSPSWQFIALVMQLHTRGNVKCVHRVNHPRVREQVIMP